MDVIQTHPREDARFGRWHAALRDGQLAGRTPVPFFSLPEYRELHTDPENLARCGRVALAVMDADEVVGAADVEFPHRWDVDTAAITLSVPPAHRRRGVGRALWERALREIDDRGRTTIETEVDIGLGVDLAASPGGAFALAQGFVSANAEQRFVLDLPLRAAPAREPSGYRFTTWRGACPESYVESYARLETTMAADAPHGDVEREERIYTVDHVRSDERSLAARGFDSLTTVVFAGAGDPAGYSVMYVGSHDTEHVHQDNTLVAGAHRGHGLGRALKLRNHRLLDDTYPGRRLVHTWTELNNAPMQRVNRSLGYRPVEVCHEMTRTR